jgi:hypothetical protein
MSTSNDWNRRTWPTVAMAVVIALTAALGAGCASSKGKGKIAKEIRNLPNGLVADTANARHTDQTLQNVDPAEGE